MLMGYCVGAFPPPRDDTAPAAKAGTVDGREVVALFQPIERVADGVAVGFEALARLRDGDGLVPPSAFLPSLSTEGSRSLFSAVLAQAMALKAALALAGRDVYVSVTSLGPEGPSFPPRGVRFLFPTACAVRSPGHPRTSSGYPSRSPPMRPSATSAREAVRLSASPPSASSRA